MKPDKNISVSEEVVTRLVNHFKPTRIYLFGSQARGEAACQSDFDFLVVMDKVPARAYRLAQEAQTLMWGIPAAVDVLFISSEKFDSLKSTIGTLPEIVHREGKSLYSA